MRVYGSLIPDSVVNSHMKGYTPEEADLVQQDLRNIEGFVFQSVSTQLSPIYVGTAGGPGSAKSTILEIFLHNEFPRNIAYIDPDTRALRFMMNTYLSKSMSLLVISQMKDFPQTQRKAYNYWRGGSNFISTTLLNKAFERRYHIAHGTTATSPAVEKLYGALKKGGYKIQLFLCYARPETRKELIAHRVKVQANCQSSPKDAILQGKMFVERFSVYFKFADYLRLYWTYGVEKGSKEVAKIEQRKLFIKDSEGYRSFVEQYERDRKASLHVLPSWGDLLKEHGVVPIKGR